MLCSIDIFFNPTTRKGKECNTIHIASFGLIISKIIIKYNCSILSQIVTISFLQLKNILQSHTF